MGDRVKGVDLDPARGGRSAQERHLHAVQSVSSSHSDSSSGCETKISPSSFTWKKEASAEYRNKNGFNLVSKRAFVVTVLAPQQRSFSDLLLSRIISRGLGRITPAYPLPAVSLRLLWYAGSKKS